MRSVRWLLLVAMIVIAAAVFGIYRAHRLTQRRQRPVASTSVPLDSKSIAGDWEWGQSANGLPAADHTRLAARQLQQTRRNIASHVAEYAGGHRQSGLAAGIIMISETGTADRAVGLPY